MAHPLHAIPTPWLRRLIVLLLVSAAACTSPSTSTETGNPPLLNTKLVSLELTAGTAYIVGQPGAVSPPSGMVTAVELLSGNTFQVPVQPDGSFRIPVSPPEGFFYVVTDTVINLNDVRMRSARDPDGVITLGELSREDTLRSLGLTCLAESYAAEGAIMRELPEVDRACSADADCAVASYDSVCKRSCGQTALRASGKVAFESFVSGLTDAVCPGYESGECSPQTNTCPLDNPPTIAKCRLGTCVLENPTLEAECGGPEVNLTWTRYPGSESPSGSTRFTYTGLWYGGLVRTEPDGRSCVSMLAKCGSLDDTALDFAMRDAVLHPDVQAAIQQGGLVHDAAGDLRYQIEIELYTSRPVSLDFARCEDCGVPDGLLTLASVLDEVGRASCTNLR